MFRWTRGARPGSWNGILPDLRRTIFPLSLSTHMTVLPVSARQAPVTSPTYPAPMIVTRTSVTSSEGAHVVSNTARAVGAALTASANSGIELGSSDGEASDRHRPTPSPRCARDV